MSSHKNQKEQLKQLNTIYQTVRSESGNMFEMLNLLAKAKDIYNQIQQSKNNSDFAVYKVNSNVTDLSDASLKSLEFDWQKFYQE